MKLILQGAERQSDCHYKGMVRLSDLVDAFKDYRFSQEVLQKAEIHKRNMEEGVAPFLVTVRLDPDSEIKEDGDSTVFYSASCDLRDGKSKLAAVCLLEEELVREGAVPAEVFVVSKEKMDKLEGNKR